MTRQYIKNNHYPGIGATSKKKKERSAGQYQANNSRRINITCHMDKYNRVYSRESSFPLLRTRYSNYEN